MEKAFPTSGTSKYPLIHKQTNFRRVIKGCIFSGLRRSSTLRGWRWRSLSGNRCPSTSLKGERKIFLDIPWNYLSCVLLFCFTGIVTWLCLQPTSKRMHQKASNRASSSGWTSGYLSDCLLAKTKPKSILNCWLLFIHIMCKLIEILRAEIREIIANGSKNFNFM